MTRIYWDEKQKARSKKRLEYFKEYRRNHPKPRRTKYIDLGYKGEIEALTFLKGAIRQPAKNGYDLSWNNWKIDVKTGKMRKNRRDWSFQVKKQLHKIDYFLCILKDRAEKTIDVLLIPDVIIKTRAYFSIRENVLDQYKQYSIFNKKGSEIL